MMRSFMKTPIDLKSLLCGLAIGVLAVFAIGAASSSSPVGKYQTTSAAGFALILDTSTGQAWGANLAAPVPGFQKVDTGFWDAKDGK